MITYLGYSGRKERINLDVDAQGLVTGPRGIRKLTSVNKRGDCYIGARTSSGKPISIMINRLVLSKYYPIPGEGRYRVKHLNGNRADCSVANLAWYKTN